MTNDQSPEPPDEPIKATGDNGSAGDPPVPDSPVPDSPVPDPAEEARQKSIDLLNATHAFPCPVMVKAIGQNTDIFVDTVVQVIRDQLRLPFDPPIRKRETKSGQHISVTIEPTFETAEEVLAVYHDLQQIDGLVMLL